ncbi:hypothetical protein [Bifidobacterium aesculapii]|uniref:hypothetical protein n=1 Tax=Bifidobacterium aesculapii TaxID=1329411 RepID=UPI000A6B6FEA|nr:hypothetical protein [Bifidobacterium aesculapii]
MPAALETYAPHVAAPMRMGRRTSVMLYRLLRSLLDDLRDTRVNLYDSYANLRSVPANLRTGVLKNAGSQRPCRKTEHWNIKETTMPV